MSENVLQFPSVEIGEGIALPPSDVLAAAQGKSFTRLVIIGEKDDGELYVASTHGASDSLMLLEMAKKIVVP